MYSVRRSAISCVFALVAVLLSGCTTPAKIYDGTEGFIPVPVPIQVPVQKVPTKCDPLRGEEQDGEVLMNGQGYNSMDRGCI